STYARGSELDYQLTFGYTFGASLGYNFTNSIGLQAEFNVDKAGQKYKDGIAYEVPGGVEYVDVFRDVDLHYFQIPLLFMYQPYKKRFGYTKKIRFYFGVGPQFGFLLSAKENIEIDREGVDNNLAGVQPKDKFSTIDMGLAANTGLNMFLGRSKNIYVNLGVNMYLGLTDINGKTIKDLNYYSDNDVKYQSSRIFRGGLNVGIHYMITNSLR
ncbi:MAG: outer membrane beta-barrel protein, partial [Chitinophagales bacterium]